MPGEDRRRPAKMPRQRSLLGDRALQRRFMQADQVLEVDIGFACGLLIGLDERLRRRGADALLDRLETGNGVRAGRAVLEIAVLAGAERVFQRAAFGLILAEIGGQLLVVILGHLLERAARLQILVELVEFGLRLAGPDDDGVVDLLHCFVDRLRLQVVIDVLLGEVLQFLERYGLGAGALDRRHPRAVLQIVPPHRHALDLILQPRRLGLPEADIRLDLAGYLGALGIGLLDIVQHALPLAGETVPDARLLLVERLDIDPVEQVALRQGAGFQRHVAEFAQLGAGGAVEGIVELQLVPGARARADRLAFLNHPAPDRVVGQRLGDVLLLAAFGGAERRNLLLFGVRIHPCHRVRPLGGLHRLRPHRRRQLHAFHRLLALQPRQRVPDQLCPAAARRRQPGAEADQRSRCSAGQRALARPARPGETAALVARVLLRELIQRKPGQTAKAGAGNAEAGGMRDRVAAHEAMADLPPEPVAARLADLEMLQLFREGRLRGMLRRRRHMRRALIGRRLAQAGLEIGRQRAQAGEHFARIELRRQLARMQRQRQPARRFAVIRLGQVIAREAEQLSLLGQHFRRVVKPAELLAHPARKGGIRIGADDRSGVHVARRQQRRSRKSRAHDHPGDAAGDAAPGAGNGRLDAAAGERGRRLGDHRRDVSDDMAELAAGADRRIFRRLDRILPGRRSRPAVRRAEIAVDRANAAARRQPCAPDRSGGNLADEHAAGGAAQAKQFRCQPVIGIRFERRGRAGQRAAGQPHRAGDRRPERAVAGLRDDVALERLVAGVFIGQSAMFAAARDIAEEPSLAAPVLAGRRRWRRRTAAARMSARTRTKVAVSRRPGSGEPAVSAARMALALERLAALLQRVRQG